ncbi:MAG: type II toxin-antitoxin system VapC family toxin [Pseudanabaenales cyanobacterium]|nr:type II toxin-antitoxin system VapC family toxin [Pseudanabaenales cyanobacterium]
MKLKVYIETSVVSYLVARPNRDIIVAAHQQITNEWWRNKRSQFENYASQLVVNEASSGEVEMAQKRLEALADIKLLETTEEAVELANDFISKGPLSEKATEDALHIAIAFVNGLDYLITWNCKHIANARMRHKIEQLCRARGYEPALICTPEELLED